MFVKKTFRPLRIPGQAGGFTLIEFLVAIVVGLIVTGAAVVLMASTIGVSSQNIKNTKVTQELRATMEIFSRAARRAGVMPDVIGCYAQKTCNNIAGSVNYFKFNDAGGTLAANVFNCVTFSLDRDLSGTIENTEWRGFRHTGPETDPGAIQIKTTGTTDANCTEGTWVPITDTDILNISDLSLITDDYDLLVSQDTSASTQSVLQVRKVTISMTGSLAAGGDSHTVSKTIRLRNDNFVVQNIP